MTQLTAQGIAGGYFAADEIVRGVDLSVSRDEIVVIIGPNGAGKSTFLKMLVGLLPIRHGRARIAARDITNLSPREISAAGIAFMPQEQNVFGAMTVRENLDMGAYAEPDRKRVRDKVDTMFSRFPMLAEKRKQLARTLSGGQRQVLGLALALMLEPQFLLLDEPSAGLSPKAAQEMLALVREVHEGRPGHSGVGVLMVEQNALAAMAIADRAVVFVQGQNLHQGNAAELAQDPEVRRLFLGG